MGYSFYKYYGKYMVAVWQIDSRGKKISFNKVLQQFSKLSYFLFRLFKLSKKNVQWFNKKKTL